MLTNDVVITFLNRYYQTLEQEEERLNQLDSVVGDGEHGFNLRKSYGLVIEKLPEISGLPLADFLKKVGMTLLAAGGGTSTTLYGFAFMKAAEIQAVKGTDLTGAAEIFKAVLAMMKERGKAKPGDKTMIDAFEPAVEAIVQSVATGAGPGEVFKAAAAAAAKGATATAAMVGRMGRALYAGERSVGTVDPGAASTALFFATLKSLF